LFSNPTHKTKTGTANRWQTDKCNPSESIKLCKPFKSKVLGFVVPFTSLSKLCTNSGPKLFLLSQTLHVLTFRHPRLNLQGHILCTTGDDDLRVILTLEVTHKVPITFNEGRVFPSIKGSLPSLKVKDLTKTFFTAKKSPHTNSSRIDIQNVMIHIVYNVSQHAQPFFH